MSPKVRSLQVYEELAGWYDRQGQAKLRDWFLVLAADTALALGQPEQAERLRQRLLHVNPHHLLRPFRSFAEALKSPDVQGYVADLRRNYPPETAEQLLQSNVKKPAAPPARAEAAEERELKVYRAREAPEEPPAKPAEPAAPARASANRPPPRPEPAPSPPRLPRPVAWTRPASHVLTRSELAAEVEEEEGATGLGFWVSSVLFVLTLLAGLALTAYAFVRPFIQLG